MRLPLEILEKMQGNRYTVGYRISYQKHEMKRNIFMQRKNKRDQIVSVLTLCYIIPTVILLCANTFFSLFQTTYMELYQDTEKPLYKADSPLLLLFLALCFIGLCGFFLMKHTVSQKLCASLERTALTFSVILCLLIIFIYRVNVACDSEALSDIAIAFLQGDYSSLSGDSYLVHYPHQLGMIAYLELIYGIFGIKSFILLQLLNTLSILSVIYFLHRITEEVFHEPKIQAMLSLLCLGMLPLYLYVTFIYGDIPGMGFAVPAIYFVIRYLSTGLRRLLLPAFFCITFAVLFKSNNSVILAALFIILLLHALQRKDFFALIFAVLLFVGPSLGNFCIESYYAKAAKLTEIPSGVPKAAWIAMGLQENDYIENGWYNSYNWAIYTKNNFDAQNTTKACMESIKESLSSFAASPKSGLKFFYRKFISQWNDPGFQSQITNEWYSRHRDDHSSLALYLIYGNGRLILEWLMNLYHFFILLGASAFTLCSIKKRSLSAALLILCVFGGYFFHMFWEAGGRYGLGYFVLCVPMAAYGMWIMAQKAVLLFQRINTCKH